MSTKRMVDILILILIAVVVPVAGRQEGSARLASPDSAATVTVAAGPEYEAGGLHQFFFGAHYRELWTTPLQVEVLDFDRFAGGLTLLKRGGGEQTKSLRFIGKDGKQYAFRSINKDPTKVLPPELQETLARSIVQDQISSAHPYAALVVGPLAKAVGVLYAEPRLVVLPDDSKLGEFRAEFKNVMGFIEERPDEGPDGEPGFAGSEKVVGTDKLFEELAEDHDDDVDSETFLMARLLDIFVGDWDRHNGQWRWARFKRDDRKLWYPIPRDRDQAFAKLDGLLPSLAEKRYVVIQMENFAKKTPDIISLVFSGRHLDRRFLNDLDHEAWRKVTEAFIAKLTDEVIAQAVRNLPPEIYAKSGEALTKKLIARRSLMSKASDQYYRNLAKFVDVKISDQNEFAEIIRQGNGDVDVKIYARDKDTGDKQDKLIYQRLFKKGETQEIRLYLLGGNDKAVVQGEAGGITLRVVGGTGRDELVDDSNAKNYFYDVKDGTQFVAAAKTKIRAGKIDSVVNRYENTPITADYGSRTKPLPFFGYNVDDGIFLGGGPIIFKYGFRKSPFARQMVFLGNYAFTTGAFRLRYAGVFIGFINNIHLYLEGEATVPKRVENFYGFGNATRRDKALEKDDFYRTRFNEYLVRPTLFTYLHRSVYVSLGAAYKFTDLRPRDNTFIGMQLPYGSEQAALLELSSAIQYDSRDRAAAPTKGLYGRLDVFHFPKVFDNESAFTKLRGDSRVYLGSKDVTLALRAAGQRVWGRFPFYEAAYLGGSVSLRGFRLQRFAGDAAALGSAELRFFLARIFLLVPTDVGLFGLADAGRVWLDGKSEGGWHKDFGGGLWLAPLRRDFTFSIGAGVSNEQTAVVAGLGFGF
ncbi:BamA/TamA family outer membrane protein [candidate division KSB1 bacterium]|nr:BamA/TamA family outer membrane protein [candidate division KSB1 bacterium]